MIIILNCNPGMALADGRMELSLDEMLTDTIVRLLMRRDGVGEAEVRRIMAEAKVGRARRLGLGAGGPGA